MINYHREMEAQIAALGGRRERLLLHSCCGPCSTAVLEQLEAHFDLSLLFYNPNIYPAEEYQRRLDTQRTLIETRYPQITLIDAPYDPEQFFLEAEGLESEPEGGARCTLCFALRLRHAAETARRLHIPYYTTTLSVSPHKDAQRINTLGAALGRECGVTFLLADFKKRGGYQRSTQLSKEMGLYRQNYCGCTFSLPAEAALSQTDTGNAR